MIPHGMESFLGLNPIDLRWGSDRLAGLCEERIGRGARSGALGWNGSLSRAPPSTKALQQSVSLAGDVFADVLSAADQVPHGLLGLCGHANGGELTSAMELLQLPGAESSPV